MDFSPLDTPPDGAPNSAALGDTEGSADMISAQSTGVELRRSTHPGNMKRANRHGTPTSFEGGRLLCFPPRRENDKPKATGREARGERRQDAPPVGAAQNRRGGGESAPTFAPSHFGRLVIHAEGPRALKRKFSGGVFKTQSGARVAPRTAFRRHSSAFRRRAPLLSSAPGNNRPGTSGAPRGPRVPGASSAARMIRARFSPNP